MAECAWRLLNEVAGNFKSALGKKLTGIYAHGSLAFGCFRWDSSDIDFLAVVNQALTHEEKRKLIRILLDRCDQAPPKGFEMSVVKGTDLNPFIYPTPFELHFSNAHLEAYQKDPDGYCETLTGSDPDLAAHCTVVRSAGKTVCGAPIHDVFGPVDRADYLDSVLMDVSEAADGISENPIYAILNLCRTLAAVRSGLVLSKADGGQWALDNIDSVWQNIVIGALNAYRSGSDFAADPRQTDAFAAHMLRVIAEEKRAFEEAENEGGNFDE